MPASTDINKSTIVVGASDKPDRYSYKAIESLTAHGHITTGVHPRLTKVKSSSVHPTIKEADEALEHKTHTVTLYVNKDRSDRIQEDLLSLHPKRVIFNPGAENEELKKELDRARIETLNACTLVMLSTGQY